MLKAGQTLWWVDRDKHIEGTVTVVKVEKTQFVVQFNGKEYTRDFSVIGNKLFYTSQLQMGELETAPQPGVKSCATCFLRYSGECTSLKDELCGDYRAKQTIPQEEMEAWPEYGDATAFRIKSSKRIVKKEKF